MTLEPPAFFTINYHRATVTQRLLHAQALRNTLMHMEGFLVRCLAHRTDGAPVLREILNELSTIIETTPLDYPKEMPYDQPAADAHRVPDGTAERPAPGRKLHVRVPAPHQ